MAACLALFDWEGEVDALKWIDLARRSSLGWASRSTISYTLEGKAQSGLKQLIKWIDEGARPDTITLISTLPPHDNLGRWHAQAGLTQDRRGKHSSFCWDALGLGFETRFCVELAQRMGLLADLQYGFAYQRSISKGPNLYAFGNHRPRRPCSNPSRRGK